MAMLIEKVVLSTNSFLEDNLDPRSEDWLLCCSPLVPLTIIAVYLLFVKKWGPSYMANRPAFEIRPIIIAYNVVQVLACFYVFFEGVRVWTRMGYSYLCQPIDRTVSEDNERIANLVYMYYILKITDLVDTIFFVLRKKFSHASFLHVYHHSGMILMGYLGCRFSLNGHFTLLGIINSFVHVVMYSYYLYTALYPDKRPSNDVKKCLTILQLVQFYLLAIHDTLPLLQPTCGVKRLWSILLVVQYVFMIALFTDFYTKAYSSPKKKAA